MDKKLKLSNNLNLTATVLCVIASGSGLLLYYVVSYFLDAEAQSVCVNAGMICVITGAAITLILGIIAKVLNKKSNWATINIVLSIVMFFVFAYLCLANIGMQMLADYYSDIGFKTGLG